MLQASKFQGVPILALTATATDKVKQDVTKILRISGCPVFNVGPYCTRSLCCEIKPSHYC